MELGEEISRYTKMKGYRPMPAEELRRNAGIPDVTGAEFEQAVEGLLNNGMLFRNRSGKIGSPERMGVVPCILRMNERGYGFAEAIRDNAGAREIYVHEDGINGAMHGDHVMIRLLGRDGNGKRMEGRVVSVFRRENETVVGTYIQEKGRVTVIPDNRKITGDIYVSGKKRNGAKEKDKVVARIIRWPEGNRNAEAEITEILGSADEPGVDILSIIRSYRIDMDFPDKTLNEAERLARSITDEEAASRNDYRSLQTVTVDGEDAKDLDDAVSISRTENGEFMLYVHIADVSHYVAEGSELDREARKRGTSVYLVDRTIPMLPPKVSNDICSLNAGEDRLAFTCRMEISGGGEIACRSFDKSIIRVDRRFTYGEVNDYLEKADKSSEPHVEAYGGMIADMAELAGILKAKREKRGAIEFDLDEARIITDEDGVPVEIFRRKRGIAESIIEEFMIAANETVAEDFDGAGMPFIYRIHEPPSEDKLRELSRFTAIFGYRIRNIGKCRPSDIRDILKKVKGKKEEKLINTVTLRTQQKARYSECNTGHFGLASAYYTHFTSPIRRYPDLFIHRIIKLYLSGRMDDESIDYYTEQAAEAAKTSSLAEQRAEEAERDSEDLKKAEYMRGHIGERFTGVISSVLRSGFFVELENTVEGFVKVSDMSDDYYYFDERSLSLVGERTSAKYRIGDSVDVILAGADPERRRIDFVVMQETKRQAGKRGPRTGGMKQYYNK